ncbi:MAG: NAD(P)-dependent oxidoreductase [Actinomycetota bacterium]|nr:NAD(P)-dependent oxidoreductase [Actinomycetota bacterium]
MRLGFCGLGQMGEPMAAQLLDAGHELAVWNRTPERVRPLLERGARQAQSPADAAVSAQGVITMLATPEALDEVVFGPEGLASNLEDGATLIEMSTVGVEAVRDVAERLPHGVGVVDAPVLGSVSHVTKGALHVFVGGSLEQFERWSPVLERLGRPWHLGPLGAGAAMKLVVNSALGTLMTGLGEALALADALGLEESQVLDILAESPIGATAKSKRDNIERAEYSPNFKLSLAVKDLGLVLRAAAGGGLELRLADAAQAWMKDAEAAGLGALDYSAVIAHIRGREAHGPNGPPGG